MKDILILVSVLLILAGYFYVGYYSYEAGKQDGILETKIEK